MGSQDFFRANRLHSHAVEPKSAIAGELRIPALSLAFLLCLACHRSAPRPSGASPLSVSGNDATRSPSAAEPSSASSGPPASVGAEAQGPSKATAILETSEHESGPFGGPVVAELTFAEALQEARDAAERDGLRVLKSIKVEPGHAQIQVYRGKDDDGFEHEIAYVLGAQMKPWRIDGYEGSSVEGPVRPAGPNGPTLVSLDMRACPGGPCAGGCGGAPHAVLQWYAGRWTEVHGLFDARFSDYDGDGAKEAMTQWGAVPIGRCAAHWCCYLLDPFHVNGLLAWNAGHWTGELARFRPWYEREREQNRRMLDADLDAGGVAKGRARRLEAAVREFLYAKMLDGDDPRSQRAFEHATAGLSLRDAITEDPIDESMLRGWEDYVKDLFAVNVPRMPSKRDK